MEAVPDPGRVDHLIEPGLVRVSPAMSSGSVMFSRAVSVGTRVVGLEDEADLLPAQEREAFSESIVRSTSPMKTWPDVGVSRPAMQCRRVDLPDPDGPMIAVNLARSKSTETSSSARTAASPSP